MASAVDNTFPADDVAVSKADFRAQMLIIKNELTSLQAKTGVAGSEAFNQWLDSGQVTSLMQRKAQLSIYGDIYVTGGTTSQGSIGTSYIKMTGFGVDGANGLSNDTTVDNANDRITIVVPGRYLVGFNVSYVGTATTVFTASVHVGQAEPTEIISASRTISGGTDKGSMGQVGVLNLSGADQVELFIKADGASKAVTAEEMHLFVTYLGI